MRSIKNVPLEANPDVGKKSDLRQWTLVELIDRLASTVSVCNDTVSFNVLRSVQLQSSDWSTRDSDIESFWDFRDRHGMIARMRISAAQYGSYVDNVALKFGECTYLRPTPPLTHWRTSGMSLVTSDGSAPVRDVHRSSSFVVVRIYLAPVRPTPAQLTAAFPRDLHASVSKGDLARVQAWVARGVRLDACVYSSSCEFSDALHIAVIKNQPAVLDWMLDQPGGSGSFCLLHRAIEHDADRCVDVLARHNVDPFALDGDNSTILHVAARFGTAVVLVPLFEAFRPALCEMSIWLDDAGVVQRGSWEEATQSELRTMQKTTLAAIRDVVAPFVLRDLAMIVCDFLFPLTEDTNKRDESEVLF